MNKLRTHLKHLVGMTSLVALAVAFLILVATGRAPAVSGQAGFDSARCWRFVVVSDPFTIYVPSPDRHSVECLGPGGLIIRERRLDGIINGIDLSPGGFFLAVTLGSRDKVLLLDPFSLETVGEGQTGKKPFLLDFGDEGTDLCVLCPKGKEVDVFDLPPLPLPSLIIPFGSQPACFTHFSGGTAVTLPDESAIALLDRMHRPIATIPVLPAPEWIASVNLGGHGGSGELFITSFFDVFFDGVAVYDASNLNRLALRRVDAPVMVETTPCRAGCVSPLAFVLHDRGRRVSVLDLDRGSRSFFDILYEVNLGMVADAAQVGSDGRCYALSRNHMQIAVIDPGNPSSTPNRILTIHQRLV